MKKSRVVFIIPSLLMMILISLIPVMKIMNNINNDTSTFAGGVNLVFLLSFILLFLTIVVELIYLLKFLFSYNFSTITKIIWAIALIVLNAFIIPYFYIKYVLGYKKVLLTTVLYFVPMLLFIGIFFYGNKVYNKKLDEQKIVREKIKEEVNVYSTKDGVVQFTFGHGYKLSDVGEYDMYVINNEKNIILTAFTYNTTGYEQKTPDEFVDKGISDVSDGKEEFNLFKERETLNVDDKNIVTVSYLGKAPNASQCIYKISAISFNSKPEYILYVVQVVTKNNYDRFSTEINDILTSAKLN